MLKKSVLSVVCAVVTGLSYAGTASAATFTEVEDAGDTPMTAQSLGGNVTKVVGTILTPDDADLYVFPWQGGYFSATTETSETTVDTQLFLFNPLGFGMTGNDDMPGGGELLLFQSTISPLYLPAGDYFLGISSFNNEPLSEDGTIFEPISFPLEAPLRPFGPGGNSPLMGFNASGFEYGPYGVILSSGYTVAVPEPAMFLGLGAIAVSMGIILKGQNS